jgi:hypothetical protein
VRDAVRRAYAGSIDRYREGDGYRILAEFVSGTARKPG